MLTLQVPATLDPTRAYFTDSTEIMNLVTRALTQYAYNPENEQMELVPDMATDLGRPQRGQHRVDVHAEGRPQVRGRH